MGHLCVLRHLAIIFVVMQIAVGCKKSEDSGSDAVVDSSGAPATTDGSPSAGLSSTIKLKGTQEIELKPKDDGAKLVDSSDNKIARFKTKGDKLRIKGADENELAEIQGEADHIKIKDAEGAALLFEFKKYDDGDYKLKDANKNVLYKVQPKDEGFKIEDADGALVAKVKVVDGKTSLKNEAGETLFSTKDAVKPLAIACLAFDKLDLPLRVGLMLRITTGAK